MKNKRFTFDLCNIPDGANPENAVLGAERWREASTQVDKNKKLLANNDAGSHRMLESLFGNSPFLSQCAVYDPVFTSRLLTKGPDDTFANIMQELKKIRAEKADIDKTTKALRIAKRQVSLTVAVGDISGIWQTGQVMAALSTFAEEAISIATACNLREAAKNGYITLANEDDPEMGSGLIILAMGKLGAGELNYSSDVDLIVFYDPAKVQTNTPDKLQAHIVRITRNIMRMIDERTVDGYVFRTDLRLRPDPGATAMAIPLAAAEIYYETLGQNWERAAMIKARPIAGDRKAGADFIKWLKPFIWRKNLDFATIQDIHSIKRQINAQRHLTKIKLSGHNVKLGHGGIREIEFYAQTQQLIWGGRQRDLRIASTTEVLDELAARDHISRDDAGQMIQAYGFLRKLEHRLQMINDEQTHTLPNDDNGLLEIAIFMGYKKMAGFATELLRHLNNVASIYAGLFDESPSLGGDGDFAGNLMFTGNEPDPETRKTLEKLGYTNPQMVDETVRKWHHGRYRSTRSVRTRAMLTELMPLLLTALGKTSDADVAFLKFDDFLSRLPSGVQLFSMLYSNTHLLDLLAEIMGEAPRLADHLSHNPATLDSVLDAGFFKPPPPRKELFNELDKSLNMDESLEDKLATSRRWANDKKFQLGVQILHDHLSPRQACKAFSNIADSALSRLRPHIEKEFIKQHGDFPESGMAVIAMGKLGGREMTPVSDLDLIFVYSIASSDAVSNGTRPLVASQYYARQSQRLINAITAQTAEGRLYEVDMRLRPSGNAGPIASSYEAFRQYHDDCAWTWEHMALTRARTICGPADICQKTAAAIYHILTKKRDAAKLLDDVAKMRARMDTENHTDSIWEIKHLRGGLVDIEFIAQYMQLRHACAHPEILATNTREALERINGNGLMDDKTTNELIKALDLWQMLQLMLRLTIIGRLTNNPPEIFQQRLAKLAGVDGALQLRQKISDTAKRVHAIFVNMIESSAK